MHEQMDTFSSTARQQCRRKISCILLAVGAAAIVASCSWMGVGSVSPSFEEAEFPTVTTSTHRVYYSVDLRIGYRTIADAIRQEIGKTAGQAEAAYMSEPPDHGLFCKVTIDPQPRSGLSNLWMFASVLSLGILPFYDYEGERVSVRYDLYADRQFTRSYTYVVSRRGLFWLGAPLVKPFLSPQWSQSIGDDEAWRNAFRATVQHLIKDATGDGVRVFP